MPNLSVEEKRWQAENDARTLAEANVIQSDPERLDKAKQAAAKMAEEERARANAMSKVARSKKTAASGQSRVPDKPSERSTYNVFQKI